MGLGHRNWNLYSQWQLHCRNQCSINRSSWTSQSDGSHSNISYPMQPSTPVDPHQQCSIHYRSPWHSSDHLHLLLLHLQHLHLWRPEQSLPPHSNQCTDSMHSFHLPLHSNKHNLIKLFSIHYLGTVMFPLIYSISNLCTDFVRERL